MLKYGLIKLTQFLLANERDVESLIEDQPAHWVKCCKNQKKASIKHQEICMRVH